MVRFPRYIIAIAWLRAAIGCAPEVDPRGQTAEPILNGATDTTHTGVVGIAIDEPDFTGTCTGTLITPNLVLTARHCVSRLSADRVFCQAFTDATGAHEATTALAPLAASTFRVTSSTLINRNSDYTTVAEVIVPPDTTGVPFCGTDIALLRLTQPMPNAMPIEPRLDLAPRSSERFIAVGYGISIPGASDQGLRRMRTRLIVGHVGMDSSSDGTEIEAEAEWVGNTGVCPGDSGGPGIDLAGRMFGVVSRGASSTCEYPVYTRVDSWAAWIREQARAAAITAAIAPPAWIEVPAEAIAQSGDECRGETQCAGRLGCVIIGDTWRCTQTNCSACPDQWTCADTHVGRACVPLSQANADAGVDDAGEPVADAGTATTPRGCACSSVVTDGNRADRRAALGLALVALATTARRRNGRTKTPSRAA